MERIPMCLYPRLIKNPKYTATKKNGGIIPAISDTRVLAVPIGCGDCMECRKKKAREWSTRLKEDIRHNKNARFITLTFSNKEITALYDEIRTEAWLNGTEIKGYELDNKAATLGVRRFTERWRKKNKKTIRHWLTTEIGHRGTENIHMHGFIWTNENIEEIKEKWKYGNIWIGKYVNEKTINYCIKYVTKKDLQHKHYKPIILTSNGIGKGYTERYDHKTNRYTGETTKETYTTRQGTQTQLPMYWRNKIYTEEEREKLWINKIEQKKRYVNGREIDISKGLEEYNEAVKQARKKNKRLGYGNGMEIYNEKEYEERLRELNQLERRITK